MDDESVKVFQDFSFNPSESPRGMLCYNVKILTPYQQKRLNTLKLKTIRENQKYLALHPEVRAIVSIITRLVMSKCPRQDIHVLVGEYFKRPRCQIENDIAEYLEAKGYHGNEPFDDQYYVPSEGEEEEAAFGEEYKTVSALSEVDVDNLENVPYEILNRIIDDAMKQLKIDDLSEVVGEGGDPGLAARIDDVDVEVKKIVVEETRREFGEDVSKEMRSLIESEILDRILYGNTSVELARPSMTEVKEQEELTNWQQQRPELVDDEQQQQLEITWEENQQQLEIVDEEQQQRSTIGDEEQQQQVPPTDGKEIIATIDKEEVTPPEETNQQRDQSQSEADEETVAKK